MFAAGAAALSRTQLLALVFALLTLVGTVYFVRAIKATLSIRKMPQFVMLRAELAPADAESLYRVHPEERALNETHRVVAGASAFLGKDRKRFAAKLLTARRVAGIVFVYTVALPVRFLSFFFRGQERHSSWLSSSCSVGSFSARFDCSRHRRA